MTLTRSRIQMSAARLFGLGAALIPAISAIPEALHDGAFGPFARLPFDLIAVALMSRRRWRFATAVWFGVQAFVNTAQVALGHSRPGWSLLVGAAFGAAAALAVLWPRLDGRSSNDRLPSLPGTWALLAALTVTVVDAVVSRCLLPDGSQDIVFVTAISSLLLFTSFAIASHLRWVRWPMQLGGAGLAALIGCSGGGGSEAFVHSTLLPAVGMRASSLLQVFATLAFALGFDWLRSPPTPFRRFARTAGFAFAVGLIPALIASPQSAFDGRTILAALGRAAAMGLALAIAPRVAGVVRPATHPRSISPRPLQRILIPVLVAPPLLLLYPSISIHSAVPVIVGVIVGLHAMAAMLIRARIIRSLLWTPTAILLVAFALKASVDFFTGPSAIVGSISACLALALVSRFFSSSMVSRHLVRRWHLPFVPAMRFGRLAVLGGAATVAAAAVIAVAIQPESRSDLMARATAPIPLDAPLLFRPPSLQNLGTGGGVGATVATDPNGRGTWVVDEERDAVTLVSDDGHRKSIAVDPWPEQLVVDKDGRAFVSCRAAGVIDEIDRDFSVHRISVGTEPKGLALDDGTGRLYAGLVTERALVAVDTTSGEVVAKRDLGIEPAVLAVTADGVAVLPGRGSSVQFLKRDLSASREVPLVVSSGRRAWHGQALVPAGRDLLVVHASVDTGLEQPVSSGGYGGSVQEPVEYMVSVIHNGQPVYYPPSLDATRRLSVAEVTGAALAGDSLLIASRGTGELVSIPLGEIGKRPLEQRKFVAGNGVSGVATARDGSLRTFAAFDRALVGVGTCLSEASHQPMGPGKLDAEMALGRKLFHQANNREIAQSTFSCATCHPDGREDGLVWRLKGTRRQTPMLATRLADTAPYNWVGSEKTLEGNLEQTVNRLGGTGLKDKEYHALARYIRDGLRAPQKPQPEDTALVAMGKHLFHDDDVGCANCHQDAALTDGARHDVGMTSPEELAEMQAVDGMARALSFDTPSLRHVGLTAPYFHDGSAPTLEAVLSNNNDRMGHTSQLTKHQRAALAAYLKTL
jgi:cytochrome c peroxidase